MANYTSSVFGVPIAVRHSPLLLLLVKHSIQCWVHTLGAAPTSNFTDTWSTGIKCIHKYIQAATDTDTHGYYVSTPQCTVIIYY